MLVQCPDCSTKYNLDETRIGHDGSKVRCTRCKTVFTVFRPIQTEEIPSRISESRPAERSHIDDSLENEFSSLFEEKAGPVAHKAPVGDNFEDELSALFEDKKATAAPSSRVDAEMLADLQGAFQQPLIDTAGGLTSLSEPAADSPKKSGKAGMVVLLLALLLAGAGAGVYFFKPDLIARFLPASPSAPVTSPSAPAKEGASQIALENVRQYFVPNEKEGQLFIIEGKAVNKFAEARELIRLKATLFDKKGAEVTTQEFMCGNVVSLYQLQVSVRADIEAALSAKVGILTNNTNIQPGAAVPFMVVFFKAPESVEEFGLEVIQSSAPQK